MKSGIVLLCNRCADILAIREQTLMGIDVRGLECERCTRPLLPSTYCQTGYTTYLSALRARGEQE